eukprot:TRINITY_DN1343_c0_g1_i3.p1 TRINITY_DN1343_c0_g1~~TRINITY_DN1343_c0_g1_i3.p1  ORF type:complete len:205 (+),score=15.51 TRINITY_DN1343_c0_g1_i3:127-741(+)
MFHVPLQITELLLSKPGMKVNAVNNEGDTALDILQQIPAHGNDANVAVDILGQLPAHDNDEYVTVDVINDSWRRMAIIRHLKARKRANPPLMTDMQMKLITVAGLILTVTFQALLCPPGGLWQDSGRGNHDINHKPGKAIQRETNPGLYKFFMAFNALGFSGSSALILITMILRIEKQLYVNSLVVLALISIHVAFILGLIMIS